MQLICLTTITIDWTVNRQIDRSFGFLWFSFQFYSFVDWNRKFSSACDSQWTMNNHLMVILAHRKHLFCWHFSSQKWKLWLTPRWEFLVRKMVEAIEIVALAPVRLEDILIYFVEQLVACKCVSVRTHCVNLSLVYFELTYFGFFGTENRFGRSTERVKFQRFVQNDKCTIA